MTTEAEVLQCQIANWEAEIRSLTVKIVAASDVAPVHDEGISEALPQVLDSLLSYARAQREADPEYRNLFATFKDDGVARAVFNAEREMKRIAMDLAGVLQQGGHKIDNDLFKVLLGLPLALSFVRGEIERDEGNACCADKARLLLKTFVHERLGMDIELIPFGR